MDDVKFEIKDNKLIRYTPLPQYGQGICQMDVVMDRKTFIECFNKWVRLANMVCDPILEDKDD